MTTASVMDDVLAPLPACIVTQRIFDAWDLWPHDLSCEIGESIERWNLRREAIGGVVYRITEDGRRLPALINMDARPNLCDPARFGGCEGLS